MKYLNRKQTLEESLQDISHYLVVDYLVPSRGSDEILSFTRYSWYSGFGHS